MRAILSRFLYVKKAGAWRTGTDCRQKAILPRRERIALSANERTAEFLDFAIQAKFAYANKLRKGNALSLFVEQRFNVLRIKAAMQAGSACF